MYNCFNAWLHSGKFRPKWTRFNRILLFTVPDNMSTVHKYHVSCTRSPGLLIGSMWSTHKCPSFPLVFLEIPTCLLAFLLLRCDTWSWNRPWPIRWLAHPHSVFSSPCRWRILVYLSDMRWFASAVPCECLLDMLDTGSVVRFAIEYQLVPIQWPIVVSQSILNTIGDLPCSLRVIRPIPVRNSQPWALLPSSVSSNVSPFTVSCIFLTEAST